MMIGLQKGSWEIVRADDFHPQRWIGKCRCGAERSFPEHRLVKPSKLSCKCQKDRAANGLRHGMSYTPIYATWNSMKARCGNPKFKYYDRYGGRGIRVCERWQEFNNFLEDMGPTYRSGLSIERRNNDGNYDPENCFWATAAQQSRNHSGNVYIDTCRGRMLMQDAAKLAGISWPGMAYRVLKGVTGEALFSPCRAYSKRAA